MAKQLTKSKDKVVSGVIGGFAEYFNFDPTLGRIVFAVASLFFFPLVVGYIIAAILMPEAPSRSVYDDYMAKKERKDVTPEDDEI